MLVKICRNHWNTENPEATEVLIECDTAVKSLQPGRCDIDLIKDGDVVDRVSLTKDDHKVNIYFMENGKTVDRMSWGMATTAKDIERDKAKAGK